MLRLQTFGGLSLAGQGGGAVGRGGQRRRLALLALLAGHGPRAVGREKLLAYFWPERTPDEARHSLAQLVYEIRRELGEDVLQSGPDDLRLSPAHLSSDVVDFEVACDRGDFETAVAGYTGPFLDGFFVSDAPEFERWVEERRAQLAGRLSVALESLARSATRSGDAVAAAGWWRRRAALEPLNAPVAVELMQALAAAGDRAGALRHAAVHEAMMRAEFGAGPEPAVAALAERLQQELWDASAPAPGAAPPRSPAGSGSPPRWPRLLIGVGSLIALMTLTAVGLRARRGPPAGEHAVVVLGAIEGPDSTLNLAVREAFRSGLEEAPAVRVLGETRTREVLRLMERSDATPLTGPVAAEVAFRQGASLAVVGSVIPVGPGLSIVARVLDPRTGEAILTVSEQPETTAGAMPALARIGQRLEREALGLARSAPLPGLPRVMTASLEALQDYALARQALARFDRPAALRFAEAALEQDSLFPMANYLVGDLEWFRDRQHDCEVHLERALALRDRLPLKERLLVQARYEQLVADRSDSALVYWERLHAAFPDEGQAFEGMAWTYRALGRYREAAAAADSALQLDSTTYAPSLSNRLFALVEAGDTAAARIEIRKLRPGVNWLALQTGFQLALRATSWSGALALYPDTTVAPGDHRTPALDPYHHVALLVNGRLGEAARVVPIIRRVWPDHQFTPRAISLQARAERSRGGPAAAASAAAREVLAWIEAADLSPPAISRLTERTVELAARAGDGLTIRAARRLLERRDAGRNLSSYRLALLTADAAAAFVSGDMRTAAHFAEASRQGMFHGRSLALTALLEADARKALGDTARAAELYRQLRTPEAFAAGDVETWAILQPEALRGLAGLGSGPQDGGNPLGRESRRPPQP